MSAPIKTVGVVGTGVIGASWTALFLARGLRVIVADPAPGAEEQLRKHLGEWWPALEELGLEEGASIENLQFVKSIAAHGKELDFVQENGPERMDIKVKIVAEIAESTNSNVVIASSSSGLPSSQFASQCKNPERILIGHPFNPPHLMPLVELVPHPGTSEAAKQVALKFYESCGKAPVLLSQETPGFVANRLQAALLNEAYSLVNRGILSAEDLDKCVTNSLGPRWAITGPFMSNVLGGGAGGFKHLLEHIGPATQVWTRDMKAHEFQFTPESIDTLNSSVNALLKKTPEEEAERHHDAKLLELLKLKKE